MTSEAKKRGDRGPDKQTRKRRTDSPERYLPDPKKPKGAGRPRGSTGGWTKFERGWCIRIAYLEAKAIMAVLWPEGQSRPVMVSAEDWRKAVAEAVPPELRREYQEVLRRREVRLEKARLRKLRKEATATDARPSSA